MLLCVMEAVEGVRYTLGLLEVPEVMCAIGCEGWALFA
jgi:hypothetical protein